MRLHVTELQAWRMALPYLEVAHMTAPHMTEHGALHTRRVLRLATQLAYVLSCSSEEITLLRLASILHDIGNWNPEKRKEHHLSSSEIIEQWAIDKALVLSLKQLQELRLLVEWHRQDYDPWREETLEDGTLVRTGLLATILRIADALDMDYQRSPRRDAKHEELFRQMYPVATKHHIGLRAIEGLRISLRGDLRFEAYIGLPDKLASQNRIPVDEAQELSLYQVSRLVKEVQNTPLHCSIDIYPLRTSLDKCFLPRQIGKKALVFSYFDPHGLVMAAISKRNLERGGHDTLVICNYEDTRSIPVFWEETAPRYIDAEVQLVCILGMVIEDEQADAALSTIQALRQQGKEVVYINHLEEGYAVVPEMVKLGVGVVLSNVWSSFYGTLVDDSQLLWGRIGAICRRDPSVHLATPTDQELEIADGVSAVFFDIMQQCKDKGVETKDAACQLIQSIISEEHDRLQEQGKASWRRKLDFELHTEVCGKVLRVIGEVPLKNRLWYGVLEREMGKHLVHRDDGLAFRTPFAVATAKSEEGIRVLFMHHWEDGNPIPMKTFVAQFAEVKGYEEAVWVACRDRFEAESLIERVIAEINVS